MRLLLLVFFLSTFGLLSAQPDLTPREGNGQVPFGIEESAMLEHFLPVITGVSNASRGAVNFQSVRPYLMPIRQVGLRGHEMAYVMASCLEYYVNLDRNYKVNLSPDYLSLNLFNQQPATTPRMVMEFLAREGTVSAAILPYDASALTTAVYATQRFRINNYLQLFRATTRERQRIFEVKRALVKGNPVIVEMKADASIRDHKRANLKATTGTEVVPLLVVSYDEDRAAFELMSCWGRYWGQNGTTWINYSDFGKLAVNGYVLVPEMLQSMTTSRP